MSKVTTIRLSDAGQAKLADLARFYGTATKSIEVAIDRLWQEGSQMNRHFGTFEEAAAAGWHRAAKLGRDVSGSDSFGYTYELDNGHRSVGIFFSEERNAIGQPGCVVPMFHDSQF